MGNVSAGWGRMLIPAGRKCIQVRHALAQAPNVADTKLTCNVINVTASQRSGHIACSLSTDVSDGLP